MDEPPMNTAILLLAAGTSARMGQSKQLLDIHGEPLLRTSCQIALASHAQWVMVVLGARAEEHRKAIQDLPLTIHTHALWANGMGGSLRAGIEALARAHPNIDSYLIMVCDQPLLTSQHLNRLMESHGPNGKGIVASRYAGQEGVPVLFGKQYLQALLSLGDQQGAKSLVQQYRDDVFSVDFPGGEIDLDTLEDYRRFLGEK